MMVIALNASGSHPLGPNLPDACTVYDLDNRRSQHSHLPVHCIFSDGSSFEFFKYHSTTAPNPTFLRGSFDGDPKHLQRGLQVPDFTAMESCLPFILQLRCICETVFDVMLSAYIAGLKAYCRRSEEKGKDLNQGSWDRAFQSAERALAAFRWGEGHRKGGDVESADAALDGGLLALHERYSINFPPRLRFCSIMSAYPVLVQEHCRRYINRT